MSVTSSSSSRSISPWRFSSGPSSRAPSPHVASPPSPPSPLSPLCLPLPPPPTRELPPRHPEFYLEDNLVIFEVDGALFKVHRYFLARESDFLRAMFQLPSGEAAAEGQTDDTAIPLHDVTRREFESLLAFLYNSMHEDGKLTLPQWIDLLSISTRFVCDKIRERAIKEIHQHRLRIDPVEKIVLSVKFEVPQWLIPSYEAICQRSQPLDITETIRLGLATAVLLMRAREMLRQDVRSRDGRVRRRAPSPPHTATSASWPGLTVADEETLFDGDRVSEVVRNVFGLQADAYISKNPERWSMNT